MDFLKMGERDSTLSGEVGCFGFCSCERRGSSVLAIEKEEGVLITMPLNTVRYLECKM